MSTLGQSKCNCTVINYPQRERRWVLLFRVPGGAAREQSARGRCSASTGLRSDPYFEEPSYGGRIPSLPPPPLPLGSGGEATTG